MGWWRIKSVECGRIDFGKTLGSKTIANVPTVEQVADPVSEKDPNKILVNGDYPAEIFDAAIGEIIEEYEKAFKREPSMEEIQGAFNFVYNALPQTAGLQTADEMGLK